MPCCNWREEYESGEPLQIRRIAEEQGIPSRFLVQILLQLKGASLVASTRGAAGGYRLARPPHEITLAEVIEVMEGDERPESNAGKTTPLVGALLELCRELGEVAARPAGRHDAGRPGRAGRPARADVVYLRRRQFAAVLAALWQHLPPTRLDDWPILNHGGTEDTEIEHLRKRESRRLRNACAATVTR